MCVLLILGTYTRDTAQHKSADVTDCYLTDNDKYISGTTGASDFLSPAAAAAMSGTPAVLLKNRYTSSTCNNLNFVMSNISIKLHKTYLLLSQFALECCLPFSRGKV